MRHRKQHVVHLAMSHCGDADLIPAARPNDTPRPLPAQRPRPLNLTVLPSQAEPAHQPLDRAAGHRAAFTAQLLPDFARAVDPVVLVPDALDRRAKLGIANYTGWQSPRIGLASLVLVGRRRGNRHDPVLGAVRVNERHHHFPRRSSSAWAKNADALRRISLAR
jgi:hypothetical protein